MPDTPTPLIWLAGATGLVGRALLTELGHEQPVLALLRRPDPSLPAQQQQQQQTALVDYAQPASFAALPAPSQVFIALGSTIAQAGSQAAFRAVDFDAVLTVARAARQAGARRCAVVSALGADPRSSVFYNRVKGEAEAALVALGFERLVIARPSLLDGERASLGQPARRGEQWALRLMRPIAGLIPAAWRPIRPERVARAMRLALAQEWAAVQVLESAELQTVGD
ncbi:NAD(P)H-binding protein [Roseateles sp.]|jgi:uncharacterized protein YbjT (DUF2867 family)|uniref:NAD(P)H-binding protein n=1 Tax=Roseateles sp. TaxID=1971397 RepID=UPI00391C7C0C